MALEPVSVGLKFGFLAVLYLFLLWVARSALKDLRRGASERRRRPRGDRAVGRDRAAQRRRRRRPTATRCSSSSTRPATRTARATTSSTGAVARPRRRRDPARGPVRVLAHARIERQGGVVVLEDLGSTNGTYLNEELLRGPQPLHPGDRIRIGDSNFVFQG